MKNFMDEDFLLENDTAKHLYFDYAAPLPIIDYHCHIDARQIYEDVRFDNICDLWLGGRNADGGCAGDHYKWRLMRANGVSEQNVTGRGDDTARFIEFAKALGLSAGNPMYHWCHLELQRYFGITEPLGEDNAKSVMERCNALLADSPELSARGIILSSNVEFIGTTDDPADSLIWHEKLAKEEELTFTVRPSFRPDKAVNIAKSGFREYIGKLADCVGRKSLDTVRDVTDALTERLEFFAAHGCVAADHGLDYIPFKMITEKECDEVFQKAMRGESISEEETDGYATYVLLSLARQYKRLGIVMEIHYSCLRNVNERMYGTLGADSGYDTIASSRGTGNLASLLSELDKTGELPKTVIFSLDPSDNEPIDTLIGCFQSDDIPGKIQHGPAWWFNDNRDGIERQLRSLANNGILGNFIGMLTDSRSFLSYTRHEYFRRILCNMLGSWVERGEYPDDEKMLRRITEGISYYNAKRYFNL